MSKSTKRKPAPAISDQMKLGEFFDAYYIPHVMENPSPEAVAGYRFALKHWQDITDDPPLCEITYQTLSDYKLGLREAKWRGRTLSINTVRKYLDHVQWVIDRAGPKMAINRLRQAAGVIAEVPWTKPPQRERRRKPPMDEARILGIYKAADAAKYPEVKGIAPGAWWRALISTMACTGLRIGQMVEIPYSAVVWDPQRPLLRLSASICRKSGSDEDHPLHPAALRDLVAIRGERELLFPAWPKPHAKTTIYKEFHRIEREAGFIPSAGVAFHGVRRRLLTELAKISPAAAQMAAGHASFQTTIRHYIGMDVLTDAVGSLPMLEKIG